jgi:hypothetical protein
MTLSFEESCSYRLVRRRKIRARAPRSLSIGEIRIFSMQPEVFLSDNGEPFNHNGYATRGLAQLRCPHPMAHLAASNWATAGNPCRWRRTGRCLCRHLVNVSVRPCGKPLQKRTAWHDFPDEFPQAVLAGDDHCRIENAASPDRGSFRDSQGPSRGHCLAAPIYCATRILSRLKGTRIDLCSRTPKVERGEQKAADDDRRRDIEK